MKKNLLCLLSSLTLNMLFINQCLAEVPITEDEFKKMFPHANPVYTYQAFVEAASKYPTFLNEGSEEQIQSELIAFFANAAHETTGGWPTAPDGLYAWGLSFAEEVGCQAGRCTAYTDPNSPYAPVPGQTYQGRGALQLSWNGNYGQASEAIYGNAQQLLANPGLVATDPELAWETAIWFWMTPKPTAPGNPPIPSAHEIMIGDPSAYGGDLFGETVNLINGSIECGPDVSSSVKAELENRIGFYKYFAEMLGAPVPSNLGQYCEPDVNDATKQ